MSQIGWGAHALILAALVVNLWIGGDYVELWLGRAARGAFELALILAYLALVVGLRVPLPWRRARDGSEADEAAAERERGGRDSEP